MVYLFFKTCFQLGPCFSKLLPNFFRFCCICTGNFLRFEGKLCTRALLCRNRQDVGTLQLLVLSSVNCFRFLGHCSGLSLVLKLSSMNVPYLLSMILVSFTCR